MRTTFRTIAGVLGFPDGPKLWAELHRHALAHSGGDDSAWLAAFEQRILGACWCRREWKRDLEALPPDFARYFEWTVAQHNLVNARLGKPQLSVADAHRIWSAVPGAPV